MKWCMCSGIKVDGLRGNMIVILAETDTGLHSLSALVALVMLCTQCTAASQRQIAISAEAYRNSTLKRQCTINAS